MVIQTLISVNPDYWNAMLHCLTLYALELSASAKRKTYCTTV